MSCVSELLEAGDGRAGLLFVLLLDGGDLVVAHAGLKEEMQGRGSGKVREFCLYGETTCETDEFGLPVRFDWASEYRGRATVVYGHTPVPEPAWLNGTINIDTGCVFGGKLTALRYPRAGAGFGARKACVCGAGEAVPGRRVGGALTPQQDVDDALDLRDVAGKRIIDTRLVRDVTIREENSAAAAAAGHRSFLRIAQFTPSMLERVRMLQFGNFLPAERGFASFRGSHRRLDC